MKKIVLTIALILTNYVHASAGTCVGHGQELSFSIYKSDTAEFANEIYGMNYDELEIFKDEILLKSKLCFELSNYTESSNSFGSAVICNGELFAPTIYGQVIFTKGAVLELINIVAPASGWRCSLAE